MSSRMGMTTNGSRLRHTSVTSASPSRRRYNIHGSARRRTLSPPGHTREYIRYIRLTIPKERARARSPHKARRPRAAGVLLKTHDPPTPYNASPNRTPRNPRMRPMCRNRLVRASQPTTGQSGSNLKYKVQCHQADGDQNRQPRQAGQEFTATLQPFAYHDTSKLAAPVPGASYERAGSGTAWNRPANPRGMRPTMCVPVPVCSSRSINPRRWNRSTRFPDS